MALHRLDVRDRLCPLSWVVTKLALERLAPGETLVVTVAPGEAVELLPRSAREAGHEVAVAGTTITILRAEPSPSGSASAGRSPDA
jgi:TusA-related sulfurtransferase